MSDHALKDASIWERIGETFTSFTDGVARFISRLFGSSNDRLIRSLGYVRNRPTDEHQVVPNSLLDQVNRLEESMKALSDEELKGLSVQFKERLAAGETLDDLLPEAFAACREAGRRTKNMRHFDVQILGGICLHRGMIAEMVTGEGKTLVATLPAYLNALVGGGVHVVTVNDYLARRDCEWMSPIYHALGVSCAYIQSDMPNEDRKRAYDCDITYGTNSEFGFDYLRDNMKPARWGDPDYPVHFHQVQRALHYAIIDEVDNILIDEARTPLIISGPAFGDLRRYAKANEVAVKLIDLEKKAQAKLKELGHGLNIPHHPLHEQQTEEEAAKEAKKKKKAEENGQEEDLDVSHVITQELEQKKEKRLGYYFEVKEKERTCHLTDEGVRKAEELAGVESFYSGGNMEWPHLIDNALKAHMLYRKDKEYVVMRHPETNEMSIIIVDEFTGRLMVGRQWSDGLHQAVEAKHAREGVQIKEETQTLATVTLQNYFKLYKKLAGMTGTAMTEASEFWKIYQLDVVAMPTNKPLQRVNYSDLIYLTEKEKWTAVVEDVERIHRWDIVHLTDKTELIGTIKRENDAQLEIELREGKEKRTVPLDQVRSIERRGRPILLGTTDVDKSEKLSALLKRRGIKHELLNAKPEYAAREAEIVAQAGRIGAVTISTNMAGRGTDIILGGNPETLAWSRLKDQYPTRLDVPDDVWKQMVDEIRAKEGMVEEGRKVADMGGLHIIGTERHEARRIDNQLRGRAGRQGDPGSSRFFLSLQDDLMRIFAGEWVAGLLQRMGMEEGQAIESRMVSRRIEAAQKKVEERNFDIRKNLLEYDEVMDYQRKRVYGFRQEILDGANCKIRILRMIEEQLDQALERYLDDDFGPASFAEMASQRLGVELNPGEFHNSHYEDAERIAKERASASLAGTVTELMDENLDPDADPKEWAWQTLSARVNNLWELKTTDRQLKQIGRDGLAAYLVQEADKHIAGVDLSKGAVYLERDWGVRSLCDWVQRKFLVEVDPNELKDLDPPQVRERVLQAIHGLYRQKESEFPVTVAMARFMSDRTAGHSPMGQRYDREGLLQWYRRRFDNVADGIPEEEFRTQSRARLQEMLVEVAKKSFPQASFADIDARLDEALEGAKAAEEEDAQEIVEWARESMGLTLQAADLTGKSPEEVRDRLYNAYELRYCPELKRMERSLLLNQLDAAWKNHLYVMDHLRQGIGLVGYAQIDPKTEYKRQGMKEFDSMWGNLADKISDAVFRLEDDEAFQESVWAIGAAVHQQAESVYAGGGIAAQQQAAIAGSQQGDKKPEPIRNRSARVGRNDPCPCGSGKKYKNCCMRAAAR